MTAGWPVRLVMMSCREFVGATNRSMFLNISAACIMPTVPEAKQVDNENEGLNYTANN